VFLHTQVTKRLKRSSFRPTLYLVYLEIHLEHLLENCSLLSNAGDGPNNKVKLVQSKHSKNTSSD